MSKSKYSLTLLVLCCLQALAQPTTPAVKPALEIRIADSRGEAAKSLMLSAAVVGQRIVAVGERATVLLSDDGGAHYRQAQRVPVTSTLTGVSFANERLGWAVGHWGVILNTTDGGENWTMQRSDMSTDQPLLDVHFMDDQHGVAVGLWSLILYTQDGGKTWLKGDPPATDGARRFDLNLYHLFAGAAGELFASAEKGKILRSTDAGLSWAVIDTGYKGSLWSGILARDGTLLVGGLRGTILRSEDQGKTWQNLKTDSTSSVTGLSQLPDGSIVGAALDGVSLESKNGRSFTVKKSPDGSTFTWIGAMADGQVLVMSRNGPVRLQR